MSFLLDVSCTACMSQVTASVTCVIKFTCMCPCKISKQINIIDNANCRNIGIFFLFIILNVKKRWLSQAGKGSLCISLSFTEAVSSQIRSLLLIKLLSNSQ